MTFFYSNMINSSELNNLNIQYIIGSTGPNGIKGPTGPTGMVGFQGPSGPSGPRGPMGITGPIGDRGPRGLQGDTGKTGITGDTGPIGNNYLTRAKIINNRIKFNLPVYFPRISYPLAKFESPTSKLDWRQNYIYYLYYPNIHTNASWIQMGREIYEPFYTITQKGRYMIQYDRYIQIFAQTVNPHSINKDPHSTFVHSNIYHWFGNPEYGNQHGQTFVDEQILQRSETFSMLFAATSRIFSGSVSDYLPFKFAQLNIQNCNIIDVKKVPYILHVQFLATSHGHSYETRYDGYYGSFPSRDEHFPNFLTIYKLF